MKSAREWWSETSESEDWIDSPESVIAAIQRDAFAAGAAAAIAKGLQEAPEIVAEFPQVLLRVDVVVQVLRAIDLEQLVSSELGQTAPREAHGS